jgi:hypothetical protein
MNVTLRCYLIVKANVSPSGTYCNGRPTVRVAKNKPDTLANEVAIKVSLDLPIGLFRRPQLSATISVPEDTLPVEISADIQDNIVEAIRQASGMDVKLTVEAGE